MLNMCSAPGSTPDRIIETACAHIASNGVAGTSVRAVAADAGVSPALVIHHFGSKEGMVAACDGRVEAALEAVFQPFSERASRDEVTGALVGLISETPYLTYVARSLRDGGELGNGLFDRLFEQARTTLRHMEEGGRVRPTDDDEMRAVLVMSLDLGMLMFAPHVERVLGAPLDSPEMARRWVEAELDLVTRPMLVT